MRHLRGTWEDSREESTISNSADTKVFFLWDTLAGRVSGSRARFGTSVGQSEAAGSTNWIAKAAASMSWWCAGNSMSRISGDLAEMSIQE